VVAHKEHVFPPVGAAENSLTLRHMPPKGSVLDAHQESSIKQDESDKRGQESEVSIEKHTEVHGNAIDGASCGLNHLAFGEFHVEQKATHHEKYLDDQAAVLEYRGLEPEEELLVVLGIFYRYRHEDH